MVFSYLKLPLKAEAHTCNEHEKSRACEERKQDVAPKLLHSSGLHDVRWDGPEGPGLLCKAYGSITRQAAAVAAAKKQCSYLGEMQTASLKSALACLFACLNQVTCPKNDKHCGPGFLGDDG